MAERDTGYLLAIRLHDSHKILKDFSKHLKIPEEEKMDKAILQVLNYCHAYFFQDLRVGKRALREELDRHLNQFLTKGVLPAYVIHTHHRKRIGETLIVSC